MKIPFRVKLTVFFTACTLLCYEVSLLRIYAILQWQNFFSIIISLAMLGFGISGSFLFIAKKRVEKASSKWILLCLILYPTLLFLGFIISSKLPFNPFLVGYESIELLYLLVSFICILIPFIFGASVFGILIQKYNIHRLYAVNLIGSGAGALVIVLIQFLIHPFHSLTLITGVALLIAIIYSSFFRKLVFIGILLFCLLFFVFVFISFDFFNLKRVSDFKPVSQALSTKNAQLLYEKYSPYGLIQVVEAEGLRSFPGLSIICPVEVPKQKRIYFDGSGSSSVIPYNKDLNSYDFLKYMTSALPYSISDISSVLIPGSGGGVSIARALSFNCKDIDALEINPIIVSLMKNEIAEFSGYIYSHPNVDVIESDIRSYINNTSKKYSLIELSFSDSYTSASSGINALNESYIYTIESFSNMYERLTPNGLISISRWTVDPPRDNIKLLATAIKSLRELGISYPGDNLIAIRSLQTFTLLISKKAISQQQIIKAKEFSNRNLFDLVYYPGIKDDEANRYIQLASPYYYNATNKLLSKNYDDFIKSHTFNIKPATDNNPYFYNFFKLKTLEHVRKYGIKWIPITDWGYLLVLFLLIFVLVISILGILLPIKLSTKEPANGKVILYFSFLGLSYFFIEIVLIQRSILYVGNPIYSASTIISGLLIFSGIGSYVSGKLSKTKNLIFFSTILIVLSLILHLFLYNFITNITSQFYTAGKIFLMLIIILPLGFFMGIPFPRGLEIIKIKHTKILPWAWGINGFFSVISILTTSIISIIFGFNAVLILASIIYLSAGLLSRRL